MVEYQDFASKAIGRHSDIEESSICTHAVKKQVLIRGDNADTALYVRVECDDCGEIAMGTHNPDSVLANEQD